MLVHPARWSRWWRVLAGACVALAATSCGTESPTAVLRVASVSIAPSPLVVYEEDGLTLHAVARDHRGVALPARPVRWHIDDTTVATLDETGRLYASGTGTTRVTATIEGVTGETSLTVKPVPVSRIVLDPGTLPLAVGETRMLRATPQDSAANALSGRAVVFTSSDSTIVSVTGEGMLTGVAPGTATITVTSGGLSASVPIPVAWGALETLGLAPSRITLIAGHTGQLVASGWDVRGNPLPGRPAASYASSDVAVVTVTPGGLVTAVAPGEATISGSSTGKTRAVAVRVIAPTGGNWIRVDNNQGELHEYNARNALITLYSNHAHLTLTAAGDGAVEGEIELPHWVDDFVPGHYEGLLGTLYQSPAAGAMAWSGGPGGCAEYHSSLTIDSAVSAGDELTSIDFSFEERCGADGPALRGAVHWRGNEPPIVGGPVVPIPNGLWTPPEMLVPAGADSWLVIQSDSGDWVGAGKVYSYAAPPVEIGAGLADGYDRLFYFEIDEGDAGYWLGLFQPMYGHSALEVGYYPVTDNALDAMLRVSSHSGCNSTRGWFAVDSVAYAAGRLSALDVRFEQHCDGAAPALHGMLHWRAPR